MYKFKYLVVGFMVLIGAVVHTGSLASASKAKCDTRAANVRCPRADLYGVNFSGRNLTGANFTNANLERAVFRNANLTGANFTGAKLTDVIFAGANLDKAVFGKGERLDLRGVKRMRGVKVNGVSFDNAAGIDFTGSTLSNMNFGNSVAGAKFVNVRFIGRIGFVKLGYGSDDPMFSVGFMEGTNFTGATFPTEVYFNTAMKGVIGLSLESLLPIAMSLNLTAMDLSGSDFRGVKARLVLTNANLTNVDLSGLTILCGRHEFGTANVTGLKAKGSTINNCKFTDTIGYPATFEGSRLFLVDLSGVKWSGVNFRGANFDAIKMVNASLRNSILDGASRGPVDFTGADFTGSSGASTMFFETSLSGQFTCPNGGLSNIRRGC